LLFILCVGIALGESDDRIVQVRTFMNNLPAAKYAELFVQVADEYKLDWRLLPALAYLESTGGKFTVGNNIFGWDSGRKHFRTIADGIHYVGRTLGTGVYYRGKTTLEKLKTYNVNEHYSIAALATMGQISLTDPLARTK